MYSTQINDMWQELQEAIENSSADHKQTNTMINLLDRLANYADDLEFEMTGIKLSREYPPFNRPAYTLPK